MRLSKLLMTVAASFLVATVSHAADSASVSGKITFDGKAPKPKKIPTDADPKCAAMHEDSPLLTEDVVLNADGTLKNVFVYVKSGLPTGATYAPPSTPAVIDQRLRCARGGRLTLGAARAFETRPSAARERGPAPPAVP